MTDRRPVAGEFVDADGASDGEPWSSAGGDAPDAADGSRGLTPERARMAILLIGGGHVVLALGFPYLPVVEEASLTLRAVLGVLAGVPGLVILAGGYRLPRNDVHPELYATVLRWCLRGIAVALAIASLIVLASSDSQVVPNVILLTALGSLAGFGAGTYDARAKTRERELRETIDRLRTSNERLEQFAYAASHDLQEPLRMVSSYLQLLEDRHRDDLDEDAREYIDFAVDGADRMRAMVESLLEYSRVDTRGKPLEPTDAGAVFETVRENFHERIEATDATVTAGELPEVLADEEQLATVFGHLLDNAIEYSGDEPPTVHVRAEPAGDMWRFAVEDEGVGIDPQFHDRVFEVFETLRVDDDGFETSTSGIGLALCERIVERHGGDIWVESEPHVGSTFTFTVPVLSGGNV